MKKLGNVFRAILLALVTCAILFAVLLGFLYMRNSLTMRDGDVQYNAGDYQTALAHYTALKNSRVFSQEAAKKADYCNYKLAEEAIDAGEWEEAERLISEVSEESGLNTKGLTDACQSAMDAEKKAAEEAEKYYDARFLEALAQTLTYQKEYPETWSARGDLYILSPYLEEEFKDGTLAAYAEAYVEALRQQADSQLEQRACDRQLGREDGLLQRKEILAILSHDYGLLADDDWFQRNYVANLDTTRSFNSALHQVYNDLISQTDRAETWPSRSYYAFHHSFRNNTANTISVTFHYYVYTAQYAQYLGEQNYVLSDIPPQASYKVYMNENDTDDGVSFYVDWEVTNIR